MKNQLENKKGIIFNESFEIFKIFIENLSNMKNINNKNLNLSKLYSNDYVKIGIHGSMCVEDDYELGKSINSIHNDK